MTVPVAFVASRLGWQQEWNRYLHHYATDIEVVAVIHDLNDLYASEWRVVLMDAASSWLTADLVESIHARSRGVVAVVEPTDQRRRQRAVGAHVDVPLESDATPQEMVAVVRAVASRHPTRSRPAIPRPATKTTTTKGAPLVVVGGPPGAHPERLAVTLASVFASQGERVLVVDVNEVDPSLAPRLGLHPEPNLASAVGRVAVNRGRARDDLQWVPDGGFWALAGLVAPPQQWASVTPRGLRAALKALGQADLAAEGEPAQLASCLIVVAGPMVEDSPRYGLTLTALSTADAVVPIGDADPLGLTALAGWIAGAASVAVRARFHPVATEARLGSAGRADVATQLEKIAGLLPDTGKVTLLPGPGRRERAGTWDARLYHQRRLVAVVSGLAQEVSA